MMAHINTLGIHVPLYLTSGNPAIGWGTDPRYPVHEGTFFGNIFEVGAHNWNNGQTVAALFCESPDLGNNYVAGRIGANQAGAPYSNPFGNGVNCDQGTVPANYGSSACYYHSSAGGVPSASNNDGYQACYGFNNPITVFRSMPYEAESAALANGAQIVTGSSMNSKNARVGYMGSSASITFSKVFAAGSGTHTIAIYYVNGSSSSRPLNISVNGGSAQTVNFPQSTTNPNWNADPTGMVQATANFNSGNNTVVFQVPNGASGPDIDWITVI